MLLINNSARLIDINHTHTNARKEKEVIRFRLMPAGKAVDVPEEAVKSSFVQALLDSGDLSKYKKPAEKPVAGDGEQGGKS